MIVQVSSQDLSRLASNVGEKYSRALLMLQMTLPGVPITYYGDELGMINGNLTGPSVDPAGQINYVCTIVVLLASSLLWALPCTCSCWQVCYHHVVLYRHSHETTIACPCSGHLMQMLASPTPPVRGCLPTMTMWNATWK